MHLSLRRFWFLFNPAQRVIPAPRAWSRRPKGRLIVDARTTCDPKGVGSPPTQIQAASGAFAQSDHQGSEGRTFQKYRDAV
jgi:hypothetical protein